MRLTLVQLRMELTTLVRNYEQLLLILVIPLGVLLFLGNVSVLPGDQAPAEIVGSVLALSIMSTAMVSTGIATGFERSYNVLKRLGVSPLGRRRLILAKAGAVGVVELVQCLLVVALALGMGWSLRGANWLSLIGAVVLGTAAFAGIGLTLAGRLRAETNLAVQNGLYLLLLAVGGVVVAADDLPAGFGRVATLLPSGALTHLLRESLGAVGDPSGVVGMSLTQSWLVLGLWALLAPLLAARLFRFST